MNDWKTKLQAEFERGEAARARGNEGQARVCARRAAGIAAREYLRRLDRPARTPSAYDLLDRLAKDPGLDADLRAAAAHLTLRVDADFTLPAGIDLLVEARRLCAGLLQD